ncbi:hypothetical protein HMPREF3156_01074, partial [Neisseria sp. HMSC06F02]
FNTQPPEGGWLICEIRSGEDIRFNTQPPEGGWVPPLLDKGGRFVSTHSRLKAAGRWDTHRKQFRRVSTHSRLKAAGRTDTQRNHTDTVSTHSRLKAAGTSLNTIQGCEHVSTHSRLKAAGASLKSLAPSGFAALISLGSQEKREREYNTAFSVTPAFTIS